jgi:putative polymerase
MIGRSAIAPPHRFVIVSACSVFEVPRPAMSPAVPETIVIVAVCFNALLAIVNGHGVQLNRGIIVFAEIAIYSAALAVIVFNADRKMQPWFLLAFFIVLNAVLLSLGNGNFNAKYPRDVLVIPVFIMLGMTWKPKDLERPIVMLQSIVAGVAFVEAFLPGTYADTMQIIKYYINTRDFAANSFWNNESTLFLSATRPGERFFSFINMPRLSSVFLEPVSLGNYCVVIAIFVVAYWQNLAVRTRAYLIVSTLALLIGCDGRLAATSIVIVTAGMLFFRNLSSRWSILYMPAILLASALFVASSNIDLHADNFSGRLAGSIATLSSVDTLGLLGLNADLSVMAADSGISYFIITQSVLGVIVIWSAVCLLPLGHLSATRLYVHGIAIFVPLTLMVSFSFFSIKVASLMWFLFGYFLMQDYAEELSSPAGVGLRPQIGRQSLTTAKNVHQS